jgi:hypothetical protein
MTALVAASRQLAMEEIGVGLAAYGRSNSVPMIGIAIIADLLNRAVQTDGSCFRPTRWVGRYSRSE